MNCLDPPWGQRLSFLQLQEVLLLLTLDFVPLQTWPSSEGSCLTQGCVPSLGAAHVQRLDNVVGKDQVLLSQHGTFMTSTPAPELSMALAEASVAVTLQANFNFCPGLLPSHPLKDTPQYITGRRIPISKSVSGGDGPRTLGMGRDARKHMLKCDLGAWSSASPLVARSLSLVVAGVLIEPGMR